MHNSVCCCSIRLKNLPGLPVIVAMQGEGGIFPRPRVVGGDQFPCLFTALINEADNGDAQYRLDTIPESRFLNTSWG